VSGSTRELLGRLVALRSVTGTANGEIVAFVRGRLEALGADCTTVPGPEPGHLNLHAVLGPRERPGLVLAGHLDVVAAERDGWSSDPFALRETAGRLYGRGTTDMKGFVAAALACAAHAASLDLPAPLHLALTCDEELGCRGAPSLIAHLAQAAPPPLAVVVGEPTGLDVATAHKGKTALRASVRGVASHSALAPQGVNAVVAAARLAVGLDDLQREIERGEPRDEAFGVPYATVHAGPIRGGAALNVVPDECTLELEVRTLPGGDASAPLTRVRALAAGLDADLRARDPRAGLELVETAAYPPLAADAPGGALAATVASLSGGQAGTAIDYGTEAGLYQAGLHAPTVVCGPGDIARAHRADEYLTCEELEDAERCLRRIADALAAGALG
jgi:acetylornithine deacetylase